MTGLATCARCGREEEISCRGMSTACYSAAYADGTLDDYPRARRRLADFAEDFPVYVARGLSFVQIAEAMGYRPSSLETMIIRARKAELLSYAPLPCGTRCPRPQWVRS